MRDREAIRRGSLLAIAGLGNAICAPPGLLEVKNDGCCGVIAQTLLLEKSSCYYFYPALSLKL